MVIIGNLCRRIKVWVNNQIATHKAISDAHHTKYIDTDAVAAVAVADDYVKNTGDTMTGKLNVSSSTPNVISDQHITEGWSTFDFSINGVPKGSQRFYHQDHASLAGSWTFYNIHNNLSSFLFITRIANSNKNRLKIHNDGMIEIFDAILKNPKNHAHSALSGTKKLVEIDIGGVPYYYEVYPVKA